MILSSDDLRWYRNDKTVLLDGAFDPLHAGHIKYFSDALLAFPGHLFICAVASDEDIRAKGREPLLDQQTRCKVVQALKAIDIVLCKSEPVEYIIGKLKPKVYVKGKDWEHSLPAEQLTACLLHDVQIVYLNTVLASSSDAVRRWALRDAERGLDRLETFMAGQQPAAVPWQPVTDYSFEARKVIEGPHAELIRDVVGDGRVLDAACGPGHLVRLLRNLSVDAYGCDLYPPDGDRFFRDDLCSPLPLWSWETPPYRYDLVINRECLEHLTVQQVGRAVRNLFLLSRKYVYITTRFTDRGVFDAATEFDVDPTHITCLSQPFLRSLCVLNGGKRRRDLETKLDHMKKGRCLVYEV